MVLSFCCINLQNFQLQTIKFPLFGMFLLKYLTCSFFVVKLQEKNRIYTNLLFLSSQTHGPHYVENRHSTNLDSELSFKSLGNKVSICETLLLH
jgi:hypothetical protein